MDVVSAEQAKIAEEAGACAVMALERVPADIRRDGGVARSTDPHIIKQIQAAVTIPVMAKARIGHFVEAQVLEALGVDFIDESEVLTPADGKSQPSILPFLMLYYYFFLLLVFLCSTPPPRNWLGLFGSFLPCGVFMSVRVSVEKK